MNIIVTFKSLYENEDEYNPYINISSPHYDIKQQLFPDEIVIPMKEIRIKYTYPLSNSVILTFKSENGFTRKDLAQKVCDGYKKIYDEENAFDNPGHIVGMLNRAQSEGPYGIWGHDIEDLMLYSVEQKDGNLFRLSVDS